MKSGVVTLHNKDSCSDKIEQYVWPVIATFVWQRPSEIWKKNEEGTSGFILSFCLWGWMGWGGYWIREKITGSNWNLRRIKSVFHVCMQLLPKGSTQLLPPPPPPPPLYCPRPPPPQAHKIPIPLETAIPTNDCVSLRLALEPEITPPYRS